MSISHFFSLACLKVARQASTVKPTVFTSLLQLTCSPFLEESLIFFTLSASFRKPDILIGFILRFISCITLLFFISYFQSIFKNMEFVQFVFALRPSFYLCHI